MAFTKGQAKEYAKTLFLSENLHQKVIAERVGVTEKTIGRWIEQGGWRKLKRSLLTTKQTQISMLYDQLEWINNEIVERESKVANSKEADVISKLTSAIEKLEVETNIGETVEVAKRFITFVQQEDLPLAKSITSWFDTYIQTLSS